jgi:hypothetical protein
LVLQVFLVFLVLFFVESMRILWFNIFGAGILPGLIRCICSLEIEWQGMFFIEVRAFFAGIGLAYGNATTTRCFKSGIKGASCRSGDIRNDKDSRYVHIRISVAAQR